MYNIRVYGLLIENDALLLSDECYRGVYMTKFPGGGHEPGEGLVDCLHREFAEELEMKIKVLKHFYTTDYYVPSFFNERQQLISVYYLVERLTDMPPKTSHIKFDFEPIHGAQSLRWVGLNALMEDDLTYPIDKKVITMLKNSFNV
jgi:ADP-ribose pyrophosphatase YjhB (NUDIX family)